MLVFFLRSSFQNFYSFGHKFVAHLEPKTIEVCPLSKIQMYVCCPSRLKKTLFAIEANRCRFWQRSEEAKRSVRRTKILSSYYILPYLNFLEAKNKEGFFSFLLKKDDGNIIILIYHDIKELLLQFSNNEQSPGAHISNKKWVNDIAEATGNIKFARISTRTPAIYIRGYENIKVCRYPGANNSSIKWINDIK